jgi:transcriptional regulator with GAF, ATPase, and Fis domain
VIERAVITAEAGKLNLDRALPETPSVHGVPASRTASPPDAILSAKELEELERTNILRALEAAKWKVSGEKGAASLLGLNASTLSSRMKALKIQKSG